MEKRYLLEKKNKGKNKTAFCVTVVSKHVAVGIRDVSVTPTVT